MSRTRQPATLSSQSTTETSRDSSTLRLTGTLRLRAEDTPDTTTAESSPGRRIRWSEDVVDNEGMGKKSSKVCCIYHKARPVGESSSESESSSSSSDSDSESETDHRNHMAHHAHPRGRRPLGENQADQPPDADSTACCSDHHHQKIKRRRRKPSPNAYEKMPKPSKNSQPRGT
ncbi:Type 1 phosphatases regulator ypi1 [Penicillium daleae]|uniref:Type 1 phosphatases regulator n=1 Tax=Penicillium daleae TaxID=63821 RepID=A0AAD6BW52_9EURO|nr:Type 1 phosphatases regulator ypi1 [Penicillium daleae]KAJ5432447.1 Type 1 phosphatases regulator ypi1 [Penicillium daleae]